MKNSDKQNFTKLTQKKGISLIVLIVTIIVIIILAAVVILTISKNNPVESAREARFKEDIRSFQDDLALTISNEYTAMQGQRDNKITTSDENEIEEKIPSFTKEYVGKLVIENDKLVYQETVTEKEKEWFEALGIKEKEKVKTAAEIVAEDTSYYGKSITNYDVNGVSDWKIFYSDGNNVYLITSDYVNVDKLPVPLNNGGSKPVNSFIDCPKAAPLRNVLSGYQGSSDITDERIKTLNNDYFNEKGYTSTNSNMKAVAYMLDIEIWSSFANEKAEYAIGGPTVEMLMSSYSKKYGVDYRARATSSTGYEISKDGGANWVEYYNEMLSTRDRLYVLPNNNGAYAMWLASPSANDPNYVMYVNGYDVNVFDYSYDSPIIGFRPLVCLKSNIQLEADGDGYKIK